MNLIFDFGNSLTKYFFIQYDEVIERGSFISIKFDDSILDIKNKGSIEKLIYSSVIDDKREQLSSVFETSKIISLKDNNLKLPFTNQYKSETLGEDRVALVSAGLNLYPDEDLLIIDLGTCITYDLVSSKKEYIGGSISPGFNLRYFSLHEHTSNLPKLNFKPIESIIGESTEEHIHAGIFNGVIGEINYNIERHKEEFPKIKTIISGGGANFLLNKIKNVIFADQDFLAYGLNHILQKNS
jgi:type III pantothenate kinase